MKKALLFLLVVSATFSTIAQGVKFGIQFAPHISYNRIKDQVEEFDITKDGTGFRFSAGPVVDIFLLDNVALSTGLWFSNKRSNVQFKEIVSEFKANPEYTLHYMQLPISIKMMVNEIAGKWRPYVQVGTTLELKVSEKFGNEVAEIFESQYDEAFAKFYDLGLMVAIGTEMNIFNSNSVFAALTYQRGLLNVMRGNFQKAMAQDVTGNPDADLQSDDELKYKNDNIGLMLGFKF